MAHTSLRITAFFMKKCILQVKSTLKIGLSCNSLHFSHLSMTEPCNVFIRQGLIFAISGEKWGIKFTKISSWYDTVQYMSIHLI